MLNSEVIQENTLSYSLSKEVLQGDKVQMFIALLDKSLRPMEDGGTSLSFQESIQPLDCFDYWNRRKEQRYYVLLTKAAFSLNKPITAFNQESLTDVGYIQQTVKEYEVREMAENLFFLKGGVMSPDFYFRLHFLRPKQEVLPAEFTEALQYIQGQHPDLGTPDLLTIQHNYDYSRVMLHRTSEMSVVVSAYYEVNSGKTLQLNYTLSYIYNLPPDLLGGSEVLMDGIRKGALAVVQSARAI
ncbi:hypothetical protein [Algivirga pacifica]|uniref:Uncharacterized protein n=1 Tax=Algivirga pacifica TaxID=1162670 RepID=A0ABP9CVK1_9BACT